MHKERREIPVVIPALNPTYKLADIVHALKTAGNDSIIVIDDGSNSSSSATVFSQVENMGCTLLRHSRNLGKGAALKTGFNWASEHLGNNLVGVVTADADGQHLPKDIEKVRTALAGNSDSLVLGCRDFSADTVPPRSRVGNFAMSKLAAVLLGIHISDTQTGLRGIPAQLVLAMMDRPANGYEFEMDMLVEAKQCGIPINETPIETVYEDNNSVSHFKPVRDSLRVFSVFIRYSLSSCLSSLIDLAAFAIVNVVLQRVGIGVTSVVLSTYIARVISAAFNFGLNKQVVFRRGDVGNSLARYALLCVASVSASAALVTFISLIVPDVWPLFIKVIVDSILFFVNYRIQQAWVFHSKPTASSQGI